MQPVQPPAGGFTRPSDFFRVASRARLDAGGVEDLLDDTVDASRLIPAAQRAAAAEARAPLEAALRDAEARTRELLAAQLRMGQRGSALMAAARRLGQTSTEDETYAVGLEVAEGQLEGAAVLVAHTSPASNGLRVRAAGARAAQLGLALDADPATASFGAEVLAGGCATAVLPDPRYAFDAALLRSGVKALVAAPAGPVDQTLPVIVAGWTSARACPREDVWFLELLAAQIALALRNAALYADLRQAALAERQAREQARRWQAAREPSEAGSGLAHALNNSLTSILGLADWVLLEGTSGLDEMRSIRDEAARMAVLVRQLQESSRRDAAEDAAVRVDPMELAGEVSAAARQRIEQRSRRDHATFDLVMEVEAAPFVRGATATLRQAWLHLVENAIDAMPGGGRVTIECRSGEASVRLGVIDEGAGMPVEARARAAEPFFTTNGPTRAGLGLETARATAERYGGRLDIQDAPGGGTSVALVLPAVR